MVFQYLVYLLHTNMWNTTKTRTVTRQPSSSERQLVLTTSLWNLLHVSCGVHEVPSVVSLSKTLYSYCLVLVSTQEDVPRMSARAYGSIYRKFIVALLASLLY